MNNNETTNSQDKLDECARMTHTVVRQAMRVRHMTPQGALSFVAAETGESEDMVLAMLDRGLLLGLRPVIGLQR